MKRPYWVEKIRDQRHNGYEFIVKLKRGYSFTKFGYNRIMELSSRAKVNEAIKIENIYVYNGERDVISVPN